MALKVRKRLTLLTLCINPAQDYGVLRCTAAVLENRRWRQCKAAAGPLSSTTPLCDVHADDRRDYNDFEVLV